MMNELFSVKLFQLQTGKFILELSGVLEDPEEVLRKPCENRAAVVKSLHELAVSVEKSF